MDSQRLEFFARTAEERFAIAPEDLAIALSVPGQLCIHHRGDEPFYPASLVKLFYLAFLEHQWGGMLSDEVQGAATDMIRDSSNDATGLILDVLTGTTGGPELEAVELTVWMEKRQAINRWFASKGYTGVMACQKTWNEGPYGRERQGYGPDRHLRNSLTANACTRLMTEISTVAILNLEACNRMLDLLARPNPLGDETADFQARGFIGRAIGPGVRLWSKAGFVETERHDIARVVAPNGREAILTIFTRNATRKPDVIPFLAQQIFQELGIPVRASVEGTEVEEYRGI